MGASAADKKRPQQRAPGLRRDDATAGIQPRGKTIRIVAVAQCRAAAELNLQSMKFPLLIVAAPAGHAHILTMSEFDRFDYSMVVKLRGNPPEPWRWEIYRAGKSHPIGQSPIFFHTMAAANKAGKAALKQLLAKLNT